MTRKPAQYLGDSLPSKVFAHKNAKPDKPTMFLRSKPSKEWQVRVENTDAHIVYKNEVTKRTTHEDPIEQEMVAEPWNVEQLGNLKKINIIATNASHGIKFIM